MSSVRDGEHAKPERSTLNLSRIGIPLRDRIRVPSRPSPGMESGVRVEVSLPECSIWALEESSSATPAAGSADTSEPVAACASQAYLEVGTGLSAVCLTLGLSIRWWMTSDAPGGL